MIAYGRNSNRIWVIGGTSGIGAACADLFQDLGLGEVWSTGANVDVRLPEHLDEFLALKKSIAGDLPTHVVYSAGINHLEWASKLSPITMSQLYAVNVTGLLNVVQRVPAARYVVIGSDAAWRPMRTSLAYCSSKAALSMAVKCLAREGYRINEVAPGMTEPTGMQRYVDQRVPEVRGWTAEQAREYERTSTPRRAQPWEIAEVVHSTLFCETDYLNGATIPVNGGR